MNWEQARADYVNGTALSQAAVARKYGVSKAAVSRRAAAENWGQLRREQSDRGLSPECSREVQEQRLRRLRRAADSLVEQVENAAKQEGLSPGSLRQLSASLRDLKQIQDLQGELDTREQEARIDRLRREVREAGDTVTIALEGWMQDFAG